MPITTTTRIVENTWDCLHCKHTNRGRDMECSKCGAPKGSTIIDKIPEAGATRDVAEVKSGTAIHATFSHGSNWICEYCKSQVRAPDGKCQECGGDKEKAKSVLEYRESMRLARDAQKIIEANNQKKLAVTVPSPSLNNSPPLKAPVEQLNYESNPSAGYRDSALKTTPSISHNPHRKTSLSKNDQDDDEKFVNSYYKHSDLIKKIAIVAAILLALGGFVWLMVYLFTDHDSNVVVGQTHWSWTRQAQHDDRLHDPGNWQGNMKPRPIQSTIICEDRIRNTFNCSSGTATAHDCRSHEECTRVPDTCTRNPDICTTVNVPETCYTTSVSCSERCSDRGNGSSSCTQTCSGGDRVCSGGGSRQDCRSVSDTCTRNPDHCEDVTVCVCDNHENWCSYDYMQWNVTAQQTTQGNDHNVLPDPRIVIDETDPRQRIIDQMRFSVKLADGPERIWSYTPRNLSDFNRFQTGNHWMLRWNRAGTTVRPLHKIR